MVDGMVCGHNTAKQASPVTSTHAGVSRGNHLFTALANSCHAVVPKVIPCQRAMTGSRSSKDLPKTWAATLFTSGLLSHVDTQLLREHCW